MNKSLTPNVTLQTQSQDLEEKVKRRVLRDKAETFFQELNSLPQRNDLVWNIGKLTDMQRLLQLITNCSYIEGRAHIVIQQSKPKKVITDTAAMLNRVLLDDNSDIGFSRKDSIIEGKLDSAVDEELEAKKILSKRTRRVGGKVEELELEEVDIFQPKRFQSDCSFGISGQKEALVKGFENSLQM